MNSISPEKLAKVAFKGEMRFLSNMYLAPFVVSKYIAESYPELSIDCSITYLSSEHFYQSFKSENPQYKELILSQERPEDTKKIAKKVLDEEYEIASNWDVIKDNVMKIALYCKFSQNLELLDKLDRVKGEIVELNYWQDTYWGVCDGIGENRLGKLLMWFRDEKHIIKRDNKSFRNKKRVFLPVIHVTDDREAFWENIQISLDANADGIFLISHGYLKASALHELGMEVKEKHPFLWIGYNFLDLELGCALLNFKYRDEVDAIWVDDCKCGVDYGFAKSLNQDSFNYKLEKKKCSMQEYLFYFGGVAFKYCTQPKDLVEACRVGVETTDVVVTSGSGTGEAAELEKIKIMSKEVRTIGSKKLALASGVSIENIDEYLPYVDIFMVASSISDSHDRLNREKTIELSKKIKEY